MGYGAVIDLFRTAITDIGRLKKPLTSFLLKVLTGIVASGA